VGKNKLKRFKVNAERRNVIEPGKDIFLNIKGKWRDFFSNQNDLVLELGCGGGEYTTGMAAVYPHRNFVGVDIKGARIFKGSTVAIEKNLLNAAFLRIRMFQLHDFFEKEEVDEIWMTFPDPRMKEQHEKRRLTNLAHLKQYRAIMKPGAVFRLKTDCFPLYEYTLEVLKSPELKITDLIHTSDLYNDPVLLEEHHGIQTFYERIFLKEGSKINYLRFRIW
jgi:tRNA (guanine-N7-)-methyltransferase